MANPLFQEFLSREMNRKPTMGGDPYVGKRTCCMKANHLIGTIALALVSAPESWQEFNQLS